MTYKRYTGIHYLVFALTPSRHLNSATLYDQHERDPTVSTPADDFLYRKNFFRCKRFRRSWIRRIDVNRLRASPTSLTSEKKVVSETSGDAKTDVALMV